MADKEDIADSNGIKNLLSWLDENKPKKKTEAEDEKFVEEVAEENNDEHENQSASEED